MEKLEDESFGFLNEIKHKNKNSRRKVLEKIGVNLCNDNKLDQYEEDKWKLFFNDHEVVIFMFNDESEVNRTKVCDILIYAISKNLINEETNFLLVSTIAQKITHVPILENSEDVRAKHVQIVMELTKFFEKKLIKCMNDIVNILKLLVLDNSPEVRILACNCISMFAFATQEKFHINSNSLVKPLLKSLNHQRYKNRISALNALSDVLLYGDDSGIEEVSGPLSQKMLDIFQVRFAVVKVFGKLLLNMKSRYSYWHRLLPALLTGLQDDDDDVKSISQDLWLAVGKKYEKENEELLKEDISFDRSPEFFPQKEKRFGIGCRLLVVKCIHHVLPAIENDITDWQPQPRIKASKLLITLILNAEIGITQYAERVLRIFLIAIQDEENAVKENISLAGSYLALFLHIEIYLPLFVSRLNDESHIQQTIVLLSIMVKSTPVSQLTEKLPQLFEVLFQEHIINTLESRHQIALMDIIECLNDKCDLSEFSYQVFFILLAAQTSIEVKENAKVLLSSHATKSNCDNVDELYKKHLPSILQEFTESAPSWQEHTPEFLSFIGILEESGSAIGYFVKEIMEIFLACTTRQSEPLVTLKLFTKFQQLLVNRFNDLNTTKELQNYLPSIIENCLLPYLPWKPGQTALVLRTGSVACLLAVCDSDTELTEDLKCNLLSCLHIIPALLEDESSDTRILSCKFIKSVHKTYLDIFNSDTLYKISNKLVSRFDDVNEKVRIEAALTLCALFSTLPGDHCVELQSARLKDLLQSMVIYLDDPHAISRQCFHESFEVMGKLVPDHGLHLLQNKTEMFKHKDLVLQLMNSFESLKMYN